MIDKNQKTFSKMDTKKYAGLCVGLVDGKVTFTNKDPEKVFEKLDTIKNKEIAIICVPSIKQVMAV